MATACLFIGWNRPYPEHQREAYSYLTGEARERLQAWRKEGWFESSEVFGLTPHGGDLNGFILIKGERQKLDELRRTDDFERFSMRMGKHFDRHGVVPGVTEEGLKKVIERNPDVMK